MSRNVTLAQLRSDIAIQADFVGGTGRYPSGTLDRFINQSIQRFRERLSTEGATHFLGDTTGTLQPLNSTSPYPFGFIDLSSVVPSVVRTYGVDITINGGFLKTLQHVPFQNRNNYGGPTGKGEPRDWAHFQTRKIGIFPAPNGTYPYRVWYLPVLFDLVSDNDTFDGVAGWEDYIVWDVVLRLIVRDQYATAFQTATAYKNEIWADILRNATKVTSAGGAVLGRDSLGDRAELSNWRVRHQLPPP